VDIAHHLTHRIKEEHRLAIGGLDHQQNISHIGENRIGFNPVTGRIRRRIVTEDPFSVDLFHGNQPLGPEKRTDSLPVACHGPVIITHGDSDIQAAIRLPAEPAAPGKHPVHQGLLPGQIGKPEAGHRSGCGFDHEASPVIFRKHPVFDP
jgi:hypothetical protein